MNLAGIIVTPTHVIDGTLTYDGGVIQAIQGQSLQELTTEQILKHAKNQLKPIVVPGFVDLHVHGAGGFDMMDGADAALRIARVHAQYGTTSLLATTLTAPLNDLETALQGVAIAQAIQDETDETQAKTQALTRVVGSRIMGVHLEGPFISDKKLGAQPSYVQAIHSVSTLEVVENLNRIAAIALITLAPELDQDLLVLKALVKLGYIVQLGHSAATYEEAYAAFANGASGVTHLFNAMSAFHHRAPALVGAALAHTHFAEIIPDLLHVHPGAIKAALRAIPCLYCVTDSTAATGMPDGQYKLGRQHVVKCANGVRLSDGTLAGSTLTMDHAFRNLVETLNLDLVEAALRCSSYACDFLGRTDRGRLTPGALADFVCLSADLQVQSVHIGGACVER